MNVWKRVRPVLFCVPVIFSCRTIPAHFETQEYRILQEILQPGDTRTKVLFLTSSDEVLPDWDWLAGRNPESIVYLPDSEQEAHLRKIIHSDQRPLYVFIEAEEIVEVVQYEKPEKGTPPIIRQHPLAELTRLSVDSLEMLREMNRTLKLELLLEQGKLTRESYLAIYGDLETELFYPQFLFHRYFEPDSVLRTIRFQELWEKATDLEHRLYPSEMLEIFSSIPFEHTESQLVFDFLTFELTGAKVGEKRWWNIPFSIRAPNR
ncbi:MAG: hypothetical protein LUD68_04415 [Rikenellaceae bacterium]|nr:hypothetical protein [Rikenellaceae bacterium]